MIPLAKSLNCDGRNGRALLCLVAFLLALGLVPGWGRAHLSWDRAFLLQGEHWRWITGHLVHLDPAHAALNAIGLALTWALYRAMWSAMQWLFIVLASAVAIDAGLWFLQPQVEWYVGASGVLHGCIAGGLVAQARGERIIAAVVGTLLAAKLAWEAAYGALPFSGEDHTVVLSAHRYGALGGAAAALVLMAIITRFAKLTRP